MHYLQCVPYAAICRFLYCLAWFDTVEFNRLPCPNNKMHDDTVFADRFPCQLSKFRIRILIGLSRIFHDHIAYKIDSAKNDRSILSNFLFFAWFDTLEFNRLPCSNIKMYDDAVFADRLRNRLTRFGIVVLIELSRLIHTHIPFMKTAKIIAAFLRISYY